MFDYLLLTCFSMACRQAQRDKECCLLYYDKHGKKRTSKEVNARTALYLFYADYRAGVQQELSSLHQQTRFISKD